MADNRRIQINFDVNGDELKKLDQATKTIDNFNKHMKNLQQSAGSIGRAFEQMNNSTRKTQQNHQDLHRMIRQFDGAIKGHKSTVDSLSNAQNNLSQRLSQFGRNIKVTMNETGKFTSTLTNFENQTVKLSGTFNAATNKISGMKKSVTVTNNAVDKMKESIKQARIEAERMRGVDISSRLPKGKAWDVQTDSLIRYGRVIQGSIDRNNKFSQTIVKQNGEVVKITGYYNRAKSALVQYNEQVSKASKSQLAQAGFNNSAVSRIGMMAESMKGLNKYTLSWNEAMGISALRMVQWSIAGTAIFGTQRALRAMISTVIELDTQFVSLRRVLDDDVNMDKLFEGAVRNANTLGIKLTEINESMIEFGRQGFKEGDIETLVKATGLLKNVADMDMTKASENMTAYLATFRKEVSDITGYIDRLNEVDNKYAVSVDQLSESVRRAGGTASAFGVSIDNLLGYTTAVAEATRESGSIIGNSFKTIFSRITTMKDAEDALSGVGVEIRNMGGNMKSVDQILFELSGKWDKLSDAEKQNLAVKVAGRYQLNRFLILMQNFDKAMMASETSSKSWGSAQRENQKYMMSLQARINKLWTALQLLAKSLGDSGVAKAFGALIEGATKVVTGFTKLVDVMGGFSFTIPVITGLITALAWQFKVLGKDSAILQAGLVNINPTLTSMGTRMGMSTAQATVLAGAVGRVTTGLKAMALATVTNPLFWIPLAVSAIVGLVGHMKQLEERQKELAKSTKDAKKEYQEFLDGIENGKIDAYEIEKYKKQLESLKEQQKNLSKYTKEHSNELLHSNATYSTLGMSVQNARLSKEQLIAKYSEETKAMKALNDEEENLIASMGIKITKSTTIADLTSQITDRENEMSKAVKNAEKALEEQRLKGILPTAEAYYELGEAIDEEANALENAIGITDKMLKQMKEQRAIIELLSGVKNKDVVQTQLLENAYSFWADMLGVTEDELKKHPELISKSIKKNEELTEIVGKLADGTATAKEKVRAQNLLTAENTEKTAKREKIAIENSNKLQRDAYERKMKKIFDHDETLNKSTSNTQSVVRKETSVVLDKYGLQRKSVEDTITKYGKFKSSVEKASKGISGSVGGMKTSTTSNLEKVNNKTDDTIKAWDALKKAFSKTLVGRATLSIKGIFSGLFGSGGNLDGDKLKDAVIKSGGGSISGNGFGGYAFTSGFGTRVHPISGKKSFHAGIDLAGPMGSPIRARQGGYVTSAGWNGGYGNMVSIMGTNGLEYRYAHAKSLNVRPGQFVPAGMTIAAMGSTGDSTGSHLHFEVRRNGQAINPTAYYHSGGIVSKERKPNEVDARLQVGEMVINKAQQKNLFSILNKRNGNDVFTGMGGPTTSYRVQRGDTFSEIAQKYFGNAYNGGIDKLKKMNPNIKNINMIYAGQTLTVPNPNHKASSKAPVKKSNPSSKPKSYFKNKDDASKYLQGGLNWIDQVEHLGIRDSQYKVRNLITPKYRNAYELTGDKKGYNEMVFDELSKFTNANQAKNMFNQANVFLNSADKAKMLQNILKNIGQNALKEINDKTTTWLDNFNKGVKDSTESVKEMINISNQVKDRKAEEQKDNFVSKYTSDVMSRLGLQEEVDPVTAMQNRMDELKNKINQRAEESALLQYRLNSGQLQPRLDELSKYRSQLENQMKAIENDFKKRGITDKSLIDQAKQPLKDRLAEITSEYNELYGAIQNGNKTLKENEAELEKLAEEYKNLEQQMKQAVEKREFTDAWGNIVRDAEGNTKMITDQGQLLMNTYENVRKELEAVQALAVAGGDASIFGPIIEKLAQTVKAYNPSVEANVDGTVVTNNNDNSSLSETKTYQADTNVTRNVTYVVQTGVALASESELREFAMLMKDIIDEEEGRSKS